jgi:hypothetical protein
MSTAVARAVESFYAFCGELVDKEGDSEFNSVEEFLVAWVVRQAAWQDCSHDFRIFLAASCFVFADWHDCRAACQDEAYWNRAIPWRITRALNGDAGKFMENGTEIFDPLYFQYFSVIE